MRCVHQALGLTGVAGLVVLALVARAAAAEQVSRPPSCNSFTERLSQASNALSLQIPPLAPHRARSDDILGSGENTWATLALPHRPGDDFSVGGTETYCRNGKFSDIFVSIEDSDHPIHPTLDLIAAAIFAYTNWPADMTISLAYKLLKKRPGLYSIAPDNVEVEQIPGAHAKLMSVTFAIELDSRAVLGAAN
jgi:hypothetical protein